jgi:hypothetical protein
MRLQGAPRGAVGKETSTDTQLKRKEESPRDIHTKSPPDMNPALRRLVVHQERLIETWKVCDTTGSVCLNPTARNGSKLLGDARWLCPNGCTTSWGTCLTSEKLICFSKTVPSTSTMAIMWLTKALSSLVTLCRARII